MNYDIRTKRKGSVAIIAIIIFVVVTASSLAISRFLKNSTSNITLDDKRVRDLYVARSGIETVYGAIVQKIYDPLDTVDRHKDYSVMDRTGIPEVIGGGFTPIKGLDQNRIKGKEKGEVLEKEIPLFNPDGSGKRIGTSKVTLELFLDGEGTAKRKDPGTWYYKITSVGTSANDSANKNIKGHTLTMFVYVQNPETPILYDGAVENPDA